MTYYLGTLIRVTTKTEKINEGYLKVIEVFDEIFYTI